MKRLQGSGLLLQRGRYKKRTVTPFWVPPGLQLAERGDSRERPRPCSPSMGTSAHRVGSRLLPGTTLEPGPATTEKQVTRCVPVWHPGWPESSAARGAWPRVGLPGLTQTQQQAALASSPALLFYQVGVLRFQTALQP